MKKLEANAALHDSYVKDGKTYVILKTNISPADLDGLQGVDLDMTLGKHYAKRSLTANSYYHVMCQHIADATGASMTEICNEMIASYGQMDEHATAVTLREDIDWRKIDYLHLKPTSKTLVNSNGILYRWYILMRGSHTYDTAEMSALINGVVSECQQLGLPTRPRAEIDRLIQLWDPHNG